MIDGMELSCNVEQLDMGALKNPSADVLTQMGIGALVIKRMADSPRL
jgi:hypothetical protein